MGLEEQKRSTPCLQQKIISNFQEKPSISPVFGEQIHDFVSLFLQIMYIRNAGRKLCVKI